MRKIITVWVCAMMIVSAFMMAVVVDDNNVGGKDTSGNGTMFTYHAPIYISGDADFATQAGIEGWLGNGTSGSPYIIEGYDIDGSVDWYCIFIEMTTVHFVVRNCYLHSPMDDLGIYLSMVQNGNLYNNTLMTRYLVGIEIDESNNITVDNNIFSKCMFGIYLWYSSGNTIARNTVFSSSDTGIYFDSSSGNIIYHNNMIDNINHAFDDGTNQWDNGYPSGGNYWNDYVGIDGDEDGIGDTPYSFSSGQDNYPLMEPWGPQSVNKSHLPIRIDNNGDFTPANGVSGGDGSQANPWIIEGWDINGAGFGYCINIGDTTDYFVVRDCYLHDAYGIGAWPYDSGLILYRVENAKAANNTVSSNSDTGILLHLSNNNIIVNNTVSSNGNAGIFLGTSSNGNTVANNTALSNNNFGILLYRSSSNIIFNNTASSNNDNGILLYLSCYSNIINNNIVSSNVNSGIALNTCDGNTIVNNSASWNTWTGISFYQSSSNTVANNTVFSNNYGIGLGTDSNDNTIEGNTVSLNNNNGINLWASGTGNIIANNNAFSNTQSGIFLGSSSNGNTIANNNASSNGNFGIQIYSSSNYNTIINNNAWGNFYSGINFYSSSDNFVASNTASSNVNSGIRLESSTFNTLVNNTASSNTQDGISLYTSSNDNIIESNMASSNIGNGIGINSCSNNTVESNTVSNNDFGFKLDFSSNNTITNNTILLNNIYGLFLYTSSSNIITNNIASSNNGFGIFLGTSSNGNTIESNTASNNNLGINLYQSSSNTVVNNTVLNNNYGMYLDSAIGNTIYHNNFISNANQAYDNTVTNIWDNGYPSGGNYWSDYSGIDWFSGPGQNILGSDGIGDAPYFNIGGGMGQQDNYPLMTPAKTGIYFPHLPIRINSNADFNAAHGVTGGDGSAGAPWVIEEYNIDGTGYGYCIYIGNTTEYFVVRNCYLHEASGVGNWPYFSDSGILFYYAQNGKIANNTVSSNNGNGIILYSSSNSNTVVSNIASKNSWDGIHLDHSSYNSFSNNIVIDNFDGIGCSYGSGHNLFSNNSISNSGRSGILVFDSSSFNTITDNSLLNNSEGISLIQNPHNNTILSNMITSDWGWNAFHLDDGARDNLISGNTLSTTNGLGIYSRNCNNNTLSENIITGNAWDGISLSSSNFNTIANNMVSNNNNGIGLGTDSNDNTIEGNTVSLNNNNGIDLWTSGTGNIIANNTAFSNYQTGIFLGSSSNGNTITNNIASSNTGNGITLYLNCSGNTIVNNTVSSNNQNGISLYLNCNSNTITKNTVSSNSQNGINLDSTIGNSIYHNNFINNANQAYDNMVTNLWDNSYPFGGNYWSDYTGIDAMNGPLQDIPGADDLGDTPYTNIGGGMGQQDNYPLMTPARTGIYFPHLPIRIDSNADFNAAHGVTGGDGSAGAPWVIEEYNIDGTGYGYCVYVGNTTDYFVVRNCYLHDSNGVTIWPYYEDTGITMYNASNGLISDNEITRIRRGIYLYNGCLDNLVIGNNVSHSSWTGIHLSTHSNNNYVIDNHISDIVGHGLACAMVENSVLENNAITNANLNGILISQANHTLIENNNISNSGQYGIQISESYNATIGSCHFTNDINGIILDAQTTNIHITGTTITSVNTGVHFSNSHHNTLEDLHIYGGTIGLQMEAANENVITNVESSGGLQGLHLMSSASNVFTNSTFSNSKYGAIVQSSDYNTFADCFMEYNTGQTGGVNTILNTYETGLEVYQNDDDWAAYSSFEEQLAIGDGGNPLFTRAVGVYGTSLFTVLIYGNMTDVVDLDMGIFLDGKDGNPIDGQTQTGEFVQYGATFSSDEFVTIINPQDGTYLIRVFGFAVLGNPGHFNMSVSLYQIGSTGIALIESDYNMISSCRMNSNAIGALVLSGSGNTFYHNNFISNTNQAFDDGANNWDDGYPSGGNYWSDYTGIDAMNGPLQDIPGADDIGDTPYTNILGGSGAQDNYPSMAPFGSTTFNNALIAGWNFISIPLVMGDTSVENVLSSISGSWSVVKYYDNTDKNDPWKTYRVGSSVNDLANIDITMGFWVNATTACNLAVSGAIPVSTEIVLHTGWNLVGYPSATDRLASNTLPTEADIVSVWQAASPYIQDFIDLSQVTMSAGNGYWVHVTMDTVWTIDW
jgi:parallel beta-helix repeat protein